jgi:hypothetical protein
LTKQGRYYKIPLKQVNMTTIIMNTIEAVPAGVSIFQGTPEQPPGQRPTTGPLTEVVLPLQLPSNVFSSVAFGIEFVAEGVAAQQGRTYSTSDGMGGVYLVTSPSIL